ncbi:hypothetical protein F5B20DRAFT_590444 [Whalleya microplaca]|nr:hypothetical protein F5B20DRAFT_590444 [Whalleya microplaca]
MAAADSSISVEAGRPKFFQHDERLLTSGFLSDVEVQCGTRTWKLHKVILSSRCVWFNKALNGKFSEAESGIVKIQDFEADQIDDLLKFIYTGVLSIKDQDEQGVFAAPIKHYETGDYFLMPELCEDALARLKQELDTAARTLQCAKMQSYCNSYEDYHYERQHSKDIRLSNKFYEAVKIVYQHKSLSKVDALRGLFVSFFSKTGLYHMAKQNNGSNTLTEVPQFASELLMEGGGCAIDLSNVHYPSSCTKCNIRPFEKACGHFEKVRLASSNKKTLQVQAYCQACAANIA